LAAADADVLVHELTFVVHEDLLGFVADGVLVPQHWFHSGTCAQAQIFAHLTIVVFFELLELAHDIFTRLGKRHFCMAGGGMQLRLSMAQLQLMSSAIMPYR
jgi:hypothetical protein